jgi:hypothetical protein
VPPVFRKLTPEGNLAARHSRLGDCATNHAGAGVAGLRIARRIQDFVEESATGAACGRGGSIDLVKFCYTVEAWASSCRHLDAHYHSEKGIALNPGDPAIWSIAPFGLMANAAMPGIDGSAFRLELLLPGWN